MEILNPTWPPLAALFHYYVARFDNRGADPHGSLHLDTAILTLTNQGICQEAMHSRLFTDVGANTKPSHAAYADGITRRLLRHRLRFGFSPLQGTSRLVLIREELGKERPVVLGFSLPMGYPGSFLDARRQWLDPTTPAPSPSNHCVLVRGYDDARQALLVQDSRGDIPEFDQGCWWMGYRVVDDNVTKAAYSLF